MTRRVDKDKWVRFAIAKGYLKPQRDGSILRCTSHDPKTGDPVGDTYRTVVYQVHKASGRVFFNMTYMGITKSLLVNRVIAWAFHPNPANLPQVNHIDGDKENNAAFNLEWATGSENEKHAHRTGLKSGRGSQNSNAKLSAADVLAIRASERTVADLAASYGVSRSTIANIIAKRTWKHL